MAKEKIDEAIVEIRKLIKEDKLIVGTDKTLKALKLGKLEKVFISLNCPSEVKATIKHYSKISKTTISQLKYPNDELGIVCKKPYSISILGLSK